MNEPKSTKPRAHRQHGTGSLRDLGEGKYRLGYDCAAPGEKRRQRFEVFHGTKTAAKARLATLIEAARKGTAHDDAITFGELADRFVQAKRIACEPTAAALYERTIRTHVTPSLGKIKARKLTPSHITKLLNDAVDMSPRKTRGQPLAPGYRQALRTLIGSICEYGMKTDVLFRNPIKMVEVPAAAHREHVRFDRDDIAKLVQASQGTPLGAVIVFAVGTGLRRGEICGLKWSDLDLKAGEFRLQRGAKNLGRTVIIGKLKTARSARTDVLPAFVLAALKDHRREQLERHLALGGRPTDGGFVFDGPGGSMTDPNELSRRFHRFIVRAGLKPLRFHDLRHCYATSAFASGVSLKVVSESLGHSSLAITSSVYVDVLDESKREKATILESYLGDAVRRGQRSGTNDA